MHQTAPPSPKRGEIWYVSFPTDPPGKFRRPVLIVSTDKRNSHPRANTVLVIPFSTTLSEHPLNIRFQPGATGLPETCELQPANISAVRKEALAVAPGTRTLSNRVIRDLARGVVWSMGVQPKDILEQESSSLPDR